MTFFDNFNQLEEALKNWFLQHQRDLPWRIERTPYRVWLSEIMLQQTQVGTVIDYYERFTGRFPTLESLAAASEDEVLALWSGLGYYSRARNLHKAAQLVAHEHAGQFPHTHPLLQTLPGIGSYTAGAILAFAFNKAAPVVDGNIARVLARLGNDKTPWGNNAGKKHFEHKSFELAKQAGSVILWQEGLMELGALVCKPSQPDCPSCPFQNLCLAKKNNTVAELPIILKKAPKTDLTIFCQLRYDDEHIWLEKNQSHALFKGLYAPPVCEPFEGGILTQRTLTHRNLKLRAKLVPMSSREHPSQHWVKRHELGRIGLSAAVKALLKQAALLSLIFVGACSVKGPSIRYVMRASVPRAPTVLSKQDPFEYAKSLLGNTRAMLGEKSYRSDCSGTAKAIYDAAGWSLGSSEGTEDIYRYVQKNGNLDSKKASPGDLVFFNSGDGKHLAHMGFVEEILPDETILFIHHMNGLIIRSRMNLKSPNLQVDPQTQTRLNHILRRGKNKGYTAGQLFAAFGRLK